MNLYAQFNAAKDFSDALLDMEDKNPTVRAVASRKAEEAFQRIVELRALAYVDAGRPVRGASI